MRNLLVFSLGLLAAVTLAQPSRSLWTRTFPLGDTGTHEVGHFTSDGQWLALRQTPTSVTLNRISLSNTITGTVTVNAPANSTFRDWRVLSWSFGATQTGCFLVGACNGPQGGRMRIVKLDQNLAVLHDWVVQGTSMQSTETWLGDAKVDSTGKLWVAGVSKVGPNFESFSWGASNPTSTTQLTQGQNAEVLSAPRLALHTNPTNGIIAILIGLVVGNETRLMSFSPMGNQNFNSLCTNEVLKELMLAFSGNAAIVGGNSLSTNQQGQTQRQVQLQKRSTADGVLLGQWQTNLLPYIEFQNYLTADPAGYVYLHDRNNQTSKLGNFEIQDFVQKWNRTTSTTARSIAPVNVDAFGFVYAPRQDANSFSLDKLNRVNAPQYSLQLANASDAPNGAAIDPRTGDVLVPAKGATLSKFVAIRQAPQALADLATLRTGAQYRSARSVMNNDRYAQGATLAVATPPANGTLQLFANGFYRYTPNTGFNGTDTFTYRLTKANLTPSTATVTLTVRP